ncbi:MAG: hypothetical protein JWP31_1154 [Aeromicrobium sp.]|nr:hypothetical protein [Aeromicrobium sp.]
MTSSTILDPTYGACAEPNNKLAPRAFPPRGLRVGLLDNGKANAETILREMTRALSTSLDVASVHVHTKDDAGLTLDDEQLVEIREQCDFVLSAMGDCGSCSAATVADGILLERAGVPAVSICTEPFRASGDVMASLYGFPGYVYLTTPHPVASLSFDELVERVTTLVPQIRHIIGIAS